MAALIEINGSGGGKVTNGELKEYETHIGEIPANTFVEIIKTVQFSEENPAASVQDTVDFGFGTGSNEGIGIPYSRCVKMEGRQFFSLCDDYADGQQDKLFAFSLSDDNKIKMGDLTKLRFSSMNNPTVSYVGGTAAIVSYNSQGEVYIAIVQVNPDQSTETLFLDQKITFSTSDFMHSDTCVTGNMKGVVIARDKTRSLYAAAWDFDLTGITYTGTPETIKTVTEFRRQYGYTDIFAKPIGENKVIASVGCESGYWLIPCEVGPNNEISYSSGVLIKGNPWSNYTDTIHNFDFAIFDNLVLVTYAKRNETTNKWNLFIHLFELNNLNLLKKSDVAIPPAELNEISFPQPAGNAFKISNNLYCILVCDNNTSIVFFKIDNGTINVLNSVNLLNGSDSKKCLYTSISGEQNEEIIAIRGNSDNYAQDILVIQLGKILHYITQSETKIDGITKTKATTEQAGKVWVLAPPAE